MRISMLICFMFALDHFGALGGPSLMWAAFGFLCGLQDFFEIASRFKE